jgi:hypothetical protein
MTETAKSYQSVLRMQSEVNERTVPNADLYADHRRRLTAHLIDLAPPGQDGRLCLMGAGNCNDVDLVALGERYREIHLVDLDVAAMARAFERQPAAVKEKLFRHGPIDLTGLLSTLDRWVKKPPPLKEIEAAIGPAVEKLLAAIPGPFDVAASCCLSTQLAHGITSTLGVNSPVLADVRNAAATVHLRTLAALLAPTGHALFISDMVSSETYPLEELTEGRDLKDVMTDLIRDGNFILGSDPALQSKLLRRDPVLSSQAAPARPIAPWIWRPVRARCFLVYGFVFEVRDPLRVPSPPR